jgi:ABC-2 type transport system permease protein
MLFEYRADFFIWTAVSLLWTSVNLLFYQVIFHQTNAIGTWSKDDVMALAGTMFIIDFVFWGYLYRCMRDFSQLVFQGSFDYVLIKPIDPQLQLLFNRFGINNINRAFVGIYLLWRYAHLTWATILPYVLLLILSLVFVYSIWFFIMVLVFYLERVYNLLEIIPNLKRAWSFPSEAYSHFGGLFFTLFIPLALVSTVPSAFSVGRLVWSDLFLLILFTAAAFAGARWFYFFSLKKYSSAGS